MSRVRSNISKKNKYWIPKERYLELKYHCLQYPLWGEELANLMPINSPDPAMNVQTGISHPTEDYLDRVEKIYKRIGIIRECAQRATIHYPELMAYIFEGVTRGYSFTQLSTQFYMPFSKNQYYEAYRRFFYFLDKEKNS